MRALTPSRCRGDGLWVTRSELDDADQRYLERVAEDAEQVLGGGIRLLDLTLSRTSATVIRARYALGAHEWATEGRGESLIDAHADLRMRLVVDRLRLGAEALIYRAR